MSEENVISIGMQAMQVMTYVAGPILLAAMAIGILISVLQAVTQINEATLTFIPKIVAVFLILMVMGPWMLQTLQEYCTSIFGNLHTWVRH